MASAKLETVFAVTVATNVGPPCPASSTMPRSTYMEHLVVVDQCRMRAARSRGR